MIAKNNSEKHDNVFSPVNFFRKSQYNPKYILFPAENCFSPILQCTKNLYFIFRKQCLKKDNLFHHFQTETLQGIQYLYF
jgi:hypothetical protein